MNVKMKQALQIAATYIGTVIGAGFATGREIVEFFTVHGSAGFAGILISGFLFIFLGTKLMLLSRKIGANTFADLNRHLFGRQASGFVSVIMFLILFGVTAVMLSGAGALFSEQLHFPFQLGVMITLLFSYAVMQHGMKGILWTNSIIVPLMILFSLCMAISVSGNVNPDAFFRGEHFTSSFKWLYSPFIYAAFNLTLAQAVLVPLSKEADSDFSIKWGGILGGAGLMLILFTSHFALYVIPNAITFEIPTAEIIRNMGRGIHLFFLAAVYGEIFTTLIGNLYGLASSVQRNMKLSTNQMLLIIMAGCYAISLWGYSSLLHYLYPLFGMIGLAFLITLTVSKISDQ